MIMVNSIVSPHFNKWKVIWIKLKHKSSPNRDDFKKNLNGLLINHFNLQNCFCFVRSIVICIDLLEVQTKVPDLDPMDTFNFFHVVDNIGIPDEFCNGDGEIDDYSGFSRDSYLIEPSLIYIII